MSTSPYWVLTLALGCAGSASIAFHATDPSFVPSPSDSPPPVYVDREALPATAFRSVGIIDVKGPDGAAKAAAKGKELGCAAVIDHRLFEQLHHQAQMRARSESTSRSQDMTLLAHGGLDPSSAKAVRPPASSRFDCVVEQNTAPTDRPLVM